MKHKWGRYLIELMIVMVIVGGIELAWVSYGQMRGDETTVLGVTANKEAQTEIASEIARLESLLEQYPTYPTILQRLVELNQLAGNEEKTIGYVKELERLNAVTK